MNEHPIKNMMETTMQKIREMVDANTVIGNPITSPDGTMIIPVSKISYGFGAGGSDLPTKSEKELFGGGSGMGVTITPVCFIVVKNGDAKLLHVAASNDAGNNIVKMVPEVLEKVSDFFKKDKKDESELPVVPEDEDVIS